MIGTVHSHAGMSAFHSGVDDADEKTFDGLHITLGNMNDDDISISASIVANGYRVIVDPTEYVNNLEMTVDIDEEVKVPYAATWKWDKKQKKMVPVKTNKYYTRRNFDQRYRVRLSKNPKFNEAWMSKVEKKTYNYTQGSWSRGWYGYNAHFENDYWKNWSGHKTKPLVNPPVKTQVAKNNKKTSGTVDKNSNPCESCIYKKHKIELIISQLQQEVKEALNEITDDDSNLTHYECIQCDTRFTVNEFDDDAGEACCPVCQTDDWLMEITATEMMMGDDHSGFDSGEPTDKMNMITCMFCESSFTENFLVEGMCPNCGAIIDVEDSKSNGVGSRIIQSQTDSGEFLDPEREAIEKALEADQDLERIPLPNQSSVPINKKPRKPGVFAKLFRKGK